MPLNCALIAIAFGLLAGCADLLDIPDDPALIQADRWTCDPPALPAGPRPERARVRVHACNFITSNCAVPVTGLTAVLCDKRDYNCLMPVQKGIGDVNGEISFEVPTGGPTGEGFDGYLRVNSTLESCTNETAFGGVNACLFLPGCDPTKPDDKCKLPLYNTALLFFNPPITADVPDPIRLPLVPIIAAGDLITAAGSMAVDPTLGVVFATALGCDGRPAAGLTFGISPSDSNFRELYLANGVPRQDATETDVSGIGALLGIPAGFVRVSAYLNSPTERREVASVGAQVLPSTITYVTLAPWPD